MPLRALLLDLDGTLATSLPVMVASYEAFLGSFGVTPTKDEFDSLNGPSLLEIVRILKERHRLPGAPEDLFARYLSIIENRYPEGVAPADGARELIDKARARGLELALVTSSGRAMASGFLERHGLAPLFDALVTAEDVSSGKPNPECYRVALERLGIVAAEALVVEDSLFGVRAATGAGIRTFALDPDERLALGDMPLARRVRDLHEAAQFLDEHGDG
ncbi:MAG: HAD family hydrolase [Deltaproteobacteria bacterium]|nr:HAD family hydrolase [Deltaproteobacteria bacterium]